MNVSPAEELADILDSRFHGNDRGEHGNDRGECGNGRGTNGSDREETDIGIEDVNDLCPRCREELGVMDLLGLGL